MSTEHIGPSLWHGREINSCTRCKYLRCRLQKSGLNPDYHYFCMHPTIMTGEHVDKGSAALLAKIKERYPDKLEHFEKNAAERKASVMANGEFISNDAYTPETPAWCPVLKCTPTT